MATRPKPGRIRERRERLQFTPAVTCGDSQLREITIYRVKIQPESSANTRRRAKLSRRWHKELRNSALRKVTRLYAWIPTTRCTRAHSPRRAEWNRFPGRNIHKIRENANPRSSPSLSLLRFENSVNSRDYRFPFVRPVPVGLAGVPFFPRTTVALYSFQTTVPKRTTVTGRA